MMNRARGRWELRCDKTHPEDLSPFIRLGHGFLPVGRVIFGLVDVVHPGFEELIHIHVRHAGTEHIDQREPLVLDRLSDEVGEVIDFPEYRGR